jgi:hypothetical protein
MSQGSLFDPCAARHGGNPASVDAHAVAREHKIDTYARVMVMLKQMPLTAKEIAGQLGRPLHTISGRLSEMKCLPLLMIEETGDRRDGSAVLRLRNKQ